LPWLDVGKAVKGKPGQVAHAHVYLHSPRGGPARIVVDYAHGLKAWVNAKLAYRSPDRGVGLGCSTALGRQELQNQAPTSPRFGVTLGPGWYRLMPKVGSGTTAEVRFAMRIMDAPGTHYETKNPDRRGVRGWTALDSATVEIITTAT
jgi:hypothetical protein